MCPVSIGAADTCDNLRIFDTSFLFSIVSNNEGITAFSLLLDNRKFVHLSDKMMFAITSIIEKSWREFKV